MSKSIKLKNNTYWDSTGVVHNKELLPNFLTKVSVTEPSTNEKVWLKQGNNIFDGILEIGTISSSTGQNSDNNDRKRSKNYISVEPNTTYTLSFNSADNAIILEYNLNKGFIQATSSWQIQPYTFTTSSTTYYIRFVSYATNTTSAILQIGSSVTQNLVYILNNNGVYSKFSDSIEASAYSTNSKIWLKHSKNIFNTNLKPVKNNNNQMTVLSTGVRATSLSTGTYRYSAYRLGGSELLGKTLTISTDVTMSSTNQGAINIYYGNDSTPDTTYADGFVTTTAGHQTLTKVLQNTFPTNCDGIYLLIFSTASTNSQAGVTVDYNNLMIELDSTANNYEPCELNEICVNDNGNYNKFSDSINAGSNANNSKVWIKNSKNKFYAYDDNIKYIARNSNESYTINGSNKLTITNNNLSWGRITLRISNLNPSAQYTMSANVTNPSNHNAGLYTEYNGNNVRNMSSNSSFKSNITFITDSDGIIEVSLFANWSATTLSETVIYDNIQLEIGTLATTYEASTINEICVNDNGNYNKFSDSINVGVNANNSKVWIKNSKNLISAAGYSKSSNGITATSNDDGTMTLNGTATDYVDLYILSSSFNTDLLHYLNTNYTTYSLSNNLSLENYFQDTSGYHGDKVTTSATNQLNRGFLRIPSGATFSNQVLTIMLNIGDTALNYEPYINPQTYINTDNGYEEYFPAVSKYSTRETIIGTWMGKPLYRKVSEYNSATSPGWSGIAFSTLGISNVEFLRIPSALGKSSSSNVWEEMVSNQNRIQINLDNSTLSLYLTDGALSKIIFVLEYTKTTD